MLRSTLLTLPPCGEGGGGVEDNARFRFCLLEFGVGGFGDERVVKGGACGIDPVSGR